MKEINYIEPPSLAKAIGVVTFGVTLLCVLPVEGALLIRLATKGSFSAEMILVWFFPIIYSLLGYLVGLIGAYLYIFFAPKMGGIEIAFKEDDIS